MLKEDTPDAVILATGAVSLENRLAAFFTQKAASLFSRLTAPVEFFYYFCSVSDISNFFF